MNASDLDKILLLPEENRTLEYLLSDVVTTQRIVDKTVVREYLRGASAPVSILLRITLAAAQLAAAQQAMTYLNAPDWDVVDFDSPVAGQLFPSLVAAQVITQEEQDTAIAALTQTHQVRWRAMGLSEEPGQGHIDALANWAEVVALDAANAADRDSQIAPLAETRDAAVTAAQEAYAAAATPIEATAAYVQNEYLGPTRTQILAGAEVEVKTLDQVKAMQGGG